jgi:hypothetical protein
MRDGCQVIVVLVLRAVFHDLHHAAERDEASAMRRDINCSGSVDTESIKP